MTTLEELRMKRIALYEPFVVVAAFLIASCHDSPPSMTPGEFAAEQFRIAIQDECENPEHCTADELGAAMEAAQESIDHDPRDD